MVKEEYIKKATSTGIFLLLAVISFFMLKPVLMSIIVAIFLAFIFLPFYKIIDKKVKNNNLSSGIVCIILIALILVPLWFLIPVLLDQSIQIFRASLTLDLVSPLKESFPQLFVSPEFSSEIVGTIQSFATGITTGMMNLIAGFLLDFPNLFLQWLVILFTFFFVLRDHDEFLKYLKSILPFSRELESKLFRSTRDITSSLIYGQILVGMLQGILVGIGFFIFGVDNALFLTILAVVAGVFPIVGATIVWVPLVIYLFFTGWDFLPILGITIFGIAGSFFENSVKPAMVSKKTNIHSGIILIGMIGGILFFGVMGFILGPLILAYLIIFVELFRNKKTPGIFIKQNN